MKLSVSISRLKRTAKLLSREMGLPLHAALDEVAAGQGYARWSLLAARTRTDDTATRMLDWLSPGDMVLIGARPGQGKTQLCFRLAMSAVATRRNAAFFSLEYNELQMAQLLRASGRDGAELEGRFLLDCSDSICADHIADAMTDAPAGTLVVVDYLQLLDQRREHPPLTEQVRSLRRRARDGGLVIVFSSQIDRSFDLSGARCPDLGDVRQPNPLDLSLFDKACFLHDGERRFRSLN
jgi:replicative DNA helicase